MRRRISIAGLLLAWLCANGALLNTVQVFAWTKMFTGYAESMTVAAALRETFDPAKPCDMCLGVATAKEATQEQLPQTIERSAEQVLLALHPTARIVFVNPPGDWPAAPAGAAPHRREPVPVPPPRV